jgi:hypothetical protein
MIVAKRPPMNTPTAPAPARELADGTYPDDDIIEPTAFADVIPTPLRVGQQWRCRITRTLFQVQRTWGEGVLIVPLREWEAMSTHAFRDRFEFISETANAGPVDPVDPV